MNVFKLSGAFLVKADEYGPFDCVLCFGCRIKQALKSHYADVLVQANDHQGRGGRKKHNNALDFFLFHCVPAVQIVAEIHVHQDDKKVMKQTSFLVLFTVFVPPENMEQ